MPPAYSRSGTKTDGEQVAAISHYCTTAAAHHCPAPTIRCEAYRDSYVKSCLLKGNVPPEYISALTR